jgi:hypothetical protein
MTMDERRKILSPQLFYAVSVCVVNTPALTARISTPLRHTVMKTHLTRYTEKHVRMLHPPVSAHACALYLHLNQQIWRVSNKSSSFQSLPARSGVMCAGCGGSLGHTWDKTRCCKASRNDITWCYKAYV